MASAIFAVLDDIAALMDDAATMTKVATQKTAGVLGDDLAVNAEKAAGFSASRELPVLWKITKGSFKNKLIILPVAFILSSFAPWSIIPILMLGGLYLAYEGAEKVVEWLFHKEKHVDLVDYDDIDPVVAENKKVKSAIATDFILSIEIIIIALGTVAKYPLSTQIFVTTAVAVAATIGVYGIVAFLVRLDDMGLYLKNRAASAETVLYRVGDSLVIVLPKIVKLLAVVGTIAMLLVAGGIYSHNTPYLHHLSESLPVYGFLFDIIIGSIVGVAVVAVIEPIGWVTNKIKSKKEV